VRQNTADDKPLNYLVFAIGTSFTSGGVCSDASMCASAITDISSAINSLPTYYYTQAAAQAQCAGQTGFYLNVSIRLIRRCSYCVR